MNILYYSVHHVLEDDEIRLFKSLGHNVVSLGVNSKDGALQAFRDGVSFNAEEIRLYNEYERLGGNFFSRDQEGQLLPRSFLQLFDACVVMHDVGFLEAHWSQLKSLKVVWRSIGQDVDAFEDRLRPLRREGLLIVRYSDVEHQIPNSVGQDAIIRFGKDEYTYAGWTGQNAQLLTFASRFESRYPVEAGDYRRIVDGMNSSLGGLENPSFANWIGLITASEQITRYQSSRAYLYASGLGVPYTLNFLEAWITGLPVIVYAPPERRGPYFEIAALLESGRDGFVCDDVESARDCCRMLLSDPGAAAMVGAEGRRSALRLFSLDKARNAWRNFFAAL